MRALYLVMVVMMLVATAMNVEGYKKLPSCMKAGGHCEKVCHKNEVGHTGYDCPHCCIKYKKG